MATTFIVVWTAFCVASPRCACGSRLPSTKPTSPAPNMQQKAISPIPVNIWLSLGAHAITKSSTLERIRGAGPAPGGTARRVVICYARRPLAGRPG